MNQNSIRLKFTRNQLGFSLIELMVVITIIGLMAAFLLMNVSQDTDRQANLESERFVAVVNEVRDESIIAGEAFFLVLDKRSRVYSFESPRDNRSLTQDNGLLKPRTIKQGVDVDWDVFEQFDEDSDADEVLPPKVWISPLGEITPFEMVFKGENLDFKVFVNEENQLERKKDNALRL